VFDVLMESLMIAQYFSVCRRTLKVDQYLMQLGQNNEVYFLLTICIVPNHLSWPLQKLIWWATLQ